MPCNYSQAIDEISLLIKTAWDVNTPAILGYIPVVYWPWVDTGIIPVTTKFYAKLSFKTGMTTQATLAGDNRRYVSTGIVIFEICGPKDDPSASHKMKELCQIVLTCLRKCPNNVRLRNSSINEKPLDAGRIRFEVLSQFQYDEIVTS